MADQGNQAPLESAGSASVAKQTHEPATSQPTRAQVARTYQMRTEIPAIPDVKSVNFAQLDVDDKSAGNFSYKTTLLDKGLIGYWRPRNTTASAITVINLDPVIYFQGIEETLTRVLTRYNERKSDSDTASRTDRVQSIATELAKGCAVMTYLKLRNIILADIPGSQNVTLIMKPRINDDLPLPAGFAFAIQQLGTVNVADGPIELIVAPSFPTLGHTFGIPTAHQPWNAYAYAEAVEYAKDLGLKFAMIDLKKKEGTAWWLFRQDYEAVTHNFRLYCPIPETNFTKSMVVTHCLWLNGYELDPRRHFVDQAALGPEDYGYMLRRPHHGINVSSYDAITAEAPEVIDNV